MDVELQAVSDQFAANNLKVDTVVRLVLAFQRTLATINGHVNGMIGAGVDVAVAEPITKGLENANTQLQATIDAIRSGTPVDQNKTVSSAAEPQQDPAAGHTGPATIPADRQAPGPNYSEQVENKEKPPQKSADDPKLMNSTGATRDLDLDDGGGPNERQATAIGAHPAPGPRAPGPDKAADRTLEGVDGASDFSGGPNAGKGTAGSTGDPTPAKRDTKRASQKS